MHVTCVNMKCPERGFLVIEIKHLVRLCLREAGSSSALNFKFHKSASASDAVCNCVLGSEVLEMLHYVACVIRRTYLVSFLVYRAAC